MIGKILLGFAAACAAFMIVTPVGRYLARAAWEEARILMRRQPIEELVRDSAVAEPALSKLRLVLDAREYAVNALGLDASASFTTFTQLDSDTLVLVLSVAYQDSLALRTWWWPIVGRVPYKGFFDVAAAQREQEKFEREGFDTELRPAAAFSTLGWFNDPLLSTTLDSDSTSLVNTVIHELLHNTLWIPDDVAFNESLASFVGHYGALAFFTARGDSAAVSRIGRGHEFDRAMGRFYASLYVRLDSVFRARPGPANREARIAGRDSIIAQARTALAAEVAPSLGITDTTWARRVRITIATLLARRVYREDPAAFEAVLVSSGGDLRNAIARIADAVRGAPRGGALDAVRKVVAADSVQRATDGAAPTR
jgi:predicted aminopeptidase